MCSSVPISHSLERDPNVTSRKSLAFVSNAMHRHDSAIFCKEPQNARIELTYVPQFKDPIAERFGQRFAVILPIPQLCKSGKNSREVIRIRRLQFVQKLPSRTTPSFAFVELYREIHLIDNINFDVAPRSND